MGPHLPCMKNTKQSSMRATVLVVWILRRRHRLLLGTILPHMEDFGRSSTRRCARPPRLDICNNNSNSNIPPLKQRTYKVLMQPNNSDEQQTTTKIQEKHT